VVRGWERCRGSGDPLYKQGNKGIMTVTLLVVDWATKYSAAVMYRYKDRYRHRHYVTVCCWWLIRPPSIVLQLCIDIKIGIDIDITSLCAAGG
jgi:hypothetical protein